LDPVGVEIEVADPGVRRIEPSIENTVAVAVAAVRIRGDSRPGGALLKPIEVPECLRRVSGVSHPYVAVAVQVKGVAISVREQLSDRVRVPRVTGLHQSEIVLVDIAVPVEVGNGQIIGNNHAEAGGVQDHVRRAHRPDRRRARRR